MPRQASKRKLFHGLPPAATRSRVVARLQMGGLFRYAAQPLPRDQALLVGNGKSTQLTDGLADAVSPILIETASISTSSRARTWVKVQHWVTSLSSIA